MHIPGYQWPHLVFCENKSARRENVYLNIAKLSTQKIDQIAIILH